MWLYNAIAFAHWFLFQLLVSATHCHSIHNCHVKIIAFSIIAHLMRVETLKPPTFHPNQSSHIISHLQLSFFKSTLRQVLLTHKDTPHNVIPPPQTKNWYLCDYSNLFDLHGAINITYRPYMLNIHTPSHPTEQVHSPHRANMHRCLSMDMFACCAYLYSTCRTLMRTCQVSAPLTYDTYSTFDLPSICVRT